MRWPPASGIVVRVDAEVDRGALRRVLTALRGAVIGPPIGVWAYLACSVTGMRKGMTARGSASSRLRGFVVHAARRKELERQFRCHQHDRGPAGPSRRTRVGAMSGYKQPSSDLIRFARNAAERDPAAMNDATLSPLEGILDARESLFGRFAQLNIAAPTVPYPAHKTVEEGKRLRGTMAGTFTKNLLLRDKKDRLFLFSIQEDRVLNLKTLHSKVGATGGNYPLDVARN